MNSGFDKQSVCTLLLAWFAESQRNFPWRSGYDPYQVWISEIMGQQTQMERVVEYFNRWLERFPGIEDVANAPEQDILKLWEGLGYYSRAKNIHRTAQQLVQTNGGCIPDDLSALLALPGIGPYTAAAILSIAYNKPFPVLDANVERLFARLLDVAQPVKQASVQKNFQDLAGEMLAGTEARLFNQALMEFGALVCTPKTPNCASCLLDIHCQALLHKTVQQRPVPVSREKKIEIVMACCIIICDDLLYIQQRLADDVWGSLWEFPGGRLKKGELPVDAARREVLEETEFEVSDLEFFATVKHYYTKYKVILHSFVCRQEGECAVPVLHAASRYVWVPLSELSDFPFPSGHRQLVDRLCTDNTGRK